MIALALFALIAVAGFTLLDSVLRSQAATETRLARLASIQRAMLVVSTDLDQVSGNLAGGGSTLSLAKTDLRGGQVGVSYNLVGPVLTRTISGEAGQRTQPLIAGVSAMNWQFYRARSGWSPVWPVSEPILATAPTPGLILADRRDDGVTAVALDLTLNGFDGQPGATLRRVISVPLMEPAQ